MEKNKKSLLVACDFTEVAVNALQHASIIAKQIKSKIVVFHVVKKEKEIVDVIEKLKNFVCSNINGKDLEFEFHAKEEIYTIQ